MYRLIPFLAAAALAGCTIPQTASFDGDGLTVDGPGSIKNQGEYIFTGDSKYRLNSDGYPYAIEYGDAYGLTMQGNGPTRFVGATLPGDINVTIASETDYGWDLATGEYTPETGVFTFRIEGFRSDASSVAAQAAAILALRVPGWQSLSADQRDALVGTTEALVAGGQTLIEAAVSAAEMFATGGASAVVPGN